MARQKLKKLKGFLIRFGSYHVRTDPVTGKQRSTGCTDPEAALMWLAERQRIAQQPATSATVGEYCDKLIARKKAGGASEATIRYYFGKLKPIREFFGEATPLSKVNEKMFDDYTMHRSSQGAQGYTITRELGALCQALKIAKRAKVFDADLEQLLPEGLQKTANVRDRALTEVEVPALIRAMPTNKWAAYCCLGVSLAVRKGEALRIRPDDVETKLEPRAMPDGSVAQEKRFYVWIRGTKTEGANRVVPVLSIFTDLFESALPYLPIENVSAPARTFKLACERAKIARCCFKDLRRTHATIVGGKGIGHDSIAKLLGHTTIAMSQRVYNQAKAEQLVPVVEAQLGRAQAVAFEGLASRDESSVPGRKSGRGPSGSGSGGFEVGSCGGSDPSGPSGSSCASGATFSRLCYGTIDNLGAPRKIRTCDLWLRRPGYTQPNLAAAEKSVLPSSTRVTPDNPSSTKADDVFATLSPDGAAVSDLSSGAVFWPNTVPNRVRNANALVPLLDGSRRVVGWVPVTDAEVDDDLRPRPYEPPSRPRLPITYWRIRRAAESFADRFGGASW